jgi:5-methylcytosine-specific restriction endonuclease McrA
MHGTVVQPKRKRAKRGRVWVKILAQEAWAEQKGRCFYCKGPITMKEITIEHMIPISKGGWDGRKNIAAACLPCNRTKGDMTHGRFFSLIKKSEPPRASIEIMSIWAARKIWRRTHRACERIMSAAG